MEMSGGESRWRGSFLIHRCNFFRELCYGFLFTISCQKDFKEICFYKADCSGSICRRNRGLPGSFIVEMASLDNNDSFFCDGRIDGYNCFRTIRLARIGKTNGKSLYSGSLSKWNHGIVISVYQGRLLSDKGYTRRRNLCYAFACLVVYGSRSLPDGACLVAICR